MIRHISGMELFIRDSLRQLRDQVTSISLRCGRNPGEITILGVTKTHPAEILRSAVAAGLTDIGENRVQEAENKILHFHQMQKLEWHLVGHLQSNKAKRAAELFDVIHSIDSLKLAARLSQASLEIGKQLSVLLQVDLAQIRKCLIQILKKGGLILGLDHNIIHIGFYVSVQLWLKTNLDCPCKSGPGTL